MCLIAPPVVVSMDVRGFLLGEKEGNETLLKVYWKTVTTVSADICH